MVLWASFLLVAFDRFTALGVQMIRVFNLTLVLAALLAASPSWAINKCTGSDGKVSYQEAACTAGASATAIKPIAPAPDSETLSDRVSKAAKQCGETRIPLFPAIGWTEDKFLKCSQAVLSETPKINSTETAAGISKQYVFRSFNAYVYVRGGVVVAVQR